MGCRTMRLIVSLLLALLAVPPDHHGTAGGEGVPHRDLGENAADPSEARLWQVFRLALRERGWRDGENLRIESRWAEDNAARLPALAAELVRLQVDLIVTRGSTYVQAAQEATASIPIVFTACRSRSDRPRRQPRPARRAHHRPGLAADRLLCQRARVPACCRPGGHADRGALEPSDPLPHPGSRR